MPEPEGLLTEARVLRHELLRRGIRLRLDGDRLVTDPPIRRLPPGVVDRITETQDQLRALLRRAERWRR